jgi:fibrillarin-like rRNA methylase|tara:strand:+ start:2600 stop:3160 length:561 start_codon:yes stop_codon:yes gene_type:complete
MKFNEIIKNDVNQNHIPLTKKYNSNDNFRNWDPFQSSLSAAILCGLEIIPINNTSSLLYIGPLQPSESLNLLDLVENNRKIFYLTKIKAQFPNEENLVQISNFNEIKNQKFSVICIENFDYSYESTIDIVNSFLKNSGYLIIRFLKSSQNSKTFFDNISKKFEVLQEVNIESFFKNNSLLILKLRN